MQNRLPCVIGFVLLVATTFDGCAGIHPGLAHDTRAKPNDQIATPRCLPPAEMRQVALPRDALANEQAFSPSTPVEAKPWRFENGWLVESNRQAIVLASAAIEVAPTSILFSPQQEPGMLLDSRALTRLPAMQERRGAVGGYFSHQWSGIVTDHREFYSLESLAWLSAGLGAGAAMANTGFDENFLRDTYIENMVLAPSDEYSEQIRAAKFIGDGYYTLPVFAVAALAEPWISELPLGHATAEWGQRSLRTILVGGPPMLGLQYLTGASRPGESSSRSHWHPFQDNNGVSGHSFMGAIPFLSAAKITENPLLKGALYAASILPALSRVDDDDHYFSQAFLGWWIAYLASSAVDRSHDAASDRHLFLYTQQNAIGIGFEWVQ